MDDQHVGDHSQDCSESERVPKQRRKRPGFIRNLNSYVTEYTENTSLHGVRYLGENRRSLFEKFWWVVFFLASLYFCIHLILKTYEKWNNSPVIVTFAQAPTPVWDIPFPAITICPQTKSLQRSFNYTYYYHKSKEKNNNMTAEEWKNYADASLVCLNHLYTTGNDTTNYNIVDYFETIAPQRPILLWICMWVNENATCDSLFTPVLTEEGICYTSNMLDRDEIFTNEVYHNKKYMQNGEDSKGWNLEDGYPDGIGLDAYPRRAMSAGQVAGMIIVLRGFDYNDDYICNGPIQGYKILLHHPSEIPRVSSQFFLIPPNSDIVVNVKPEMIGTSKNLRHYTPQQRQCYFSDERDLAFYKQYTQQNCQMECLTNYTRSACNCVAYYMPHDENTPICANAKLLCMKNVRDGMVEKEVSQSFDRDPSSSAEGEVKCDCLPACTSLTYGFEYSKTIFQWPEMFESYEMDRNEIPGLHATRMTVFFKEMQFITSTRNELYGVTDFLANCGGLLGLCIGFSFLSGVETLYFLTLRMWCNIWRHGRHSWSGAANQ